MSTRCRNTPRIWRRATLFLPGCALAAALVAATPEPTLSELDEVGVTTKVSWPLEDYLEYPRYDSVVLSPDGAHLAMGWGEDDFGRRLSVFDFPSMQLRGSKPNTPQFGVTDIRWLGPRRLLIQPDWPATGLRGVRSPVGTLQIKDINAGALQVLHPPIASIGDAFEGLRLTEQVAKRIPMNREATVFEPVKQRTKEGEQAPFELLKPVPTDRESTAFGPVNLVAARTEEANQLLFQTQWTDLGAFSRDLGVYSLDTVNCEQKRLAALPLRGAQVLVGAAGRVALAVGINESNESVVYYLPEDAGKEMKDWQLRVKSPSGERGLLPVAWAGQDDEYYALDGRNLPTRAVVMWNARNNTQRLLYRHPDADMDAAWFDPAGKPWMFSGLSHDPVYWYPDPAHPLAQLHRSMVQLLPHDHVDILNATDDLSMAVARVSSGKRSPVYLIMDVRTGKSLSDMLLSYPKLRGRRIAPVEAIEFRARDGLEIRGYLTTPLDAEGKPRRGVPLLVIAHNGPRDGMVDYRYVANDQYEFERQLFASRGYAVLQVNTRGTGGRGTAFEQAGDGKWGREVQDDYADGVRWAIQNGVAAAGHTCFYGTGYGAYSATMAAARNPELFQCVIGVGGIYDLPGLLKGDKKANRWGVPGNVTQDLLGPAKGAPVCLFRQDMESVIEMPKAKAREEANLAQAVQRAVNLVWAEEAKRPQKIPPSLQRAVGADLEALRTASPVTHAKSIKARMFLIEEYRDPLVPTSDDQHKAMQKALKAAGNAPRTDTIGKAIGIYGPGYFNLKARADVYKDMLSFLDKQIGQ